MLLFLIVLIFTGIDAFIEINHIKYENELNQRPIVLKMAAALFQ